MIDKSIQIPSEFKQRQDAKAWFLVVSNAAVVVAGGVVAWHINTWWAYLIAFVLVGARGQACYILQHEAMHNLLFGNPKTNERVGVVLSALLGTQFFLGRKIHWEHHFEVGTDNDPNRFFHDVTERPPGAKIIAFFLSNLMGARLLLLVRNLMSTLVRYVTGKEAADNASNSPPLSPRKSRIDLAALLAIQLLMLVLISLLSSPIVYFSFYLLPLSTLTALFELTRSFSEHVLPGRPTCEAERHRCFFMEAGRIERFFISQFDFHYHHVHHLHPNVVTFKVRALHEWLLANDPDYHAKFKTRPGYVGTVWRYICNRHFAGAGEGFPVLSENIAKA